MSNFSFSHSVFKRHEHKGLFGIELNGMISFQCIVNTCFGFMATVKPLTLYSILVLTHQKQKTFKNIVGIEELLVMSNFFFSHNVFYSDNCTPFVRIFYIISLFAAELAEPKIGLLGKGLRVVT